MPLPRSGDELAQLIMARWRWYAYRVRFHPWTTDELPKFSRHAVTTSAHAPGPADRHLAAAVADAVGAVDRGPRPAESAHLHHLRGRHRADALRGLRDQRLRGPQLRSARGAHQDRPLAAGRVSTLEALVLFAILALTALVLALQLNRLTLLSGGGGRVSRGHLPVRQALPVGAADVPRSDVRLGNPDGVRRAKSNPCREIAWLLLLANVLWVTVYDTIYAMVDRDDDIKIGVRSTAILFGDSDRHIIAAAAGDDAGLAVSGRAN